MSVATSTTEERIFRPLDYRDDPDAFRAEVRAWLDARVPRDWKKRVQGVGHDEYGAFQRGWLEEMATVGLAAPHWPGDWGGADLPLGLQVIVYEEMARADAPDPDVFTISLYHVPATLFGYGTAAQRDRYLGPARAGEEIWCQGFSEPGSGSDLASLRTRAERRVNAEGKEVYVINGQKIWSSYAMMADFCLLLARTDPDAPRKQAGISYFILDMKSPGLTVRPIKQITGETEFNEVFLDNVEIPVENRIGAENEGWRIAQSTLSAERGLIVFNLCERLVYAFRNELEAGRDGWMKDAQHRRDFAALYGELRGVRLLIRRMLREVEENPDMGGATITAFIKLRWAQLLFNFTDFQQRVGGRNAQAYAEPIYGAGSYTGCRINDLLRSYAWTISGGTNEIMRNVIAERLLGLPKG